MKFSFWLMICFSISSFGQTDSVKFDYDKALRIASEYAKNDRFAEARLLCERILRDKPEYTDARMLLGNTLFWDKHYDDARDQFYKIFEYDNGNRDAILALIQLEIGRGNVEAASELAKSALARYPDDTEFLLKYAEASQFAGNFLEAKKGLILVLEKDPANEVARNMYRNILNSVPVSNKGMVLSGVIAPYDIVNVDTLYNSAQNLAINSQYGEARNLCEQILAYRPEFYPARVLAAQTYAWGNDFESARRELKKIKVEETGFRDGILCWIEVEKWARNYTNAIEYCNLGLKFYHFDEEFLLKKAELYEASGNIFEAKRTLFNYISTNPNDIRFKQRYNQLVEKTNALALTKGVVNVQPVDSLLFSKPLDSLLADARQLAYDGDYVQSSNICQQIISALPANFEANQLLGNIRSWEKNYTEAIKIFEPLIKQAFDSKEIIESLADNEIWLEDFDRANYWIKYGLSVYPGDPDLLFKKATIYQRTGDIPQANQLLDALLAKDPTNKDYRKAYQFARGPLEINGISLETTLSRYKVPVLRTWNMLGLRYYKSNSSGTYIGSINTGYVGNDTSKFMQNAGVQFEVDAFPKFPKQKRYFHLNLGLSPSSVFARQRLGAHIYNQLGTNWELSGGINYMRFRSATDTVNVFIFDAGVTRYLPFDNMITFGITLSPVSQKWSQGYSLALRHQFSQENWVQLSLGTGMFPDNPLYYSNDPTYVPGQLLNSYNLLLAGQYRFGASKWIGRVYAGYQREEYRQNLFRNSTTLNIAAIYLLKN